METKDGLEIFNSNTVIDYIIRTVLTKEDLTVDSKFVELVENTSYKDDGLLQIELKVNNIVFDLTSANILFTEIFDKLENTFVEQYKDLDEEVDRRVQDKLSIFFDKIEALRYED